MDNSLYSAQPPYFAFGLFGLVLMIVLWTHGFKRYSISPPLLEPPDAELIWGHERKVFFQEPGRLFRSWTNDLGLAYRIKAAFGAPDILVLSDPVGIAHILQKRIFDYHHSQVVRPRIARLLGKGLGWVEGESEHKRMKRLLSLPLSANSIRSMSSGVREAASTVLSDLIETIRDEGNRKPINILQWTGKATLSIVGRVAFLHDFEGGNSLDAQTILLARRKGVTPTKRYAGFLTLMLLRRFPILNDLPIFSIQAQGLAKQVIQSGVAEEMIRRNKRIFPENLSDNHKDLLTTLLHATASEKISNEELYEQISTFIIAGHETTTAALGFTIWELARHPDIQDRLRKEIQDFSAEPTYDDYISKLPYLDAVLKETLRLYPGLPYMERVATKHDAIPLSRPVPTSDGNETESIEVRPGQTILIPIIAIQRSDIIWKDPDVFRPERWFEELPPHDLLCSGWSNLLVFSDGPRNCIGARLAIFQYKVIISLLLTSLRFEATGAQISLNIASSLQPWIVSAEEEGPQLPVYIKVL